MDMLLSFAVSRGFEFDRATVRCMVLPRDTAHGRRQPEWLAEWWMQDSHLRGCEAPELQSGPFVCSGNPPKSMVFGKIEVPEVPCRLEIIAYSCGSASGFLLQLDFSHPVVVQ
jgi:hypothetical protein